MKNLRVISLLMAALMILSVVFISCSGSGNSKNTTTLKPAKTTAPLPDRPDTKPEEQLPGIPDPETPVAAGDEFDAWHSDHQSNVVQILNVTSSDITPYNDTTETFPSLYDQDLTTKLGGTTGTQTVTLIIECAPNTKLASYAIVTAGDSATYERTPGAWTLYGTNADPTTATDDDWKVLDDVKNAGTENVNDTGFAYDIDAANQAEYTHYKMVFTMGVRYEYTLSGFQLSELFFYAAA